MILMNYRELWDQIKQPKLVENYRNGTDLLLIRTAFEQFLIHYWHSDIDFYTLNSYLLSLRDRFLRFERLKMAKNSKLILLKHLYFWPHSEKSWKVAIFSVSKTSKRIPIWPLKVWILTKGRLSKHSRGTWTFPRNEHFTVFLANKQSSAHQGDKLNSFRLKKWVIFSLKW